MPIHSFGARRAGTVVAGLAAVSTLAVAPIAAQATTSSPAAAKPKITGLKVTPTSPTQGKGFKVSFKSNKTNTYTIGYDAGQSGGPLVAKAKAKAGKTYTSKTVGKSLTAGKVTVEVIWTSGDKSSIIAKTKVTIKKK